MAKRRVLIYCLLLFSMLLSPATLVRASLSDLLNKQDELEAQIKEKQKLSEQKAKQAATLEGQISFLESDIASTEEKIRSTNGQIFTVEKEIGEVKGTIAEKEQELSRQTHNFNNAVVELYRSGRQSNLEKLLASEDLSDALEKTTYLDVLQDSINQIIGEIGKVKADLEGQKSSLEEKNSSLHNLREQQAAAKYSAEAQQSQKTSLLGATRADKEKYDAQIAKLQKEKSQISAAIYAERARGRGGESFGGGSSGYPYSAIDVPDAWGFLTRECTSYAAWAWNARFGKRWHNTQPGRGSAKYWPEIARTLGYSVSSTPRVGAIISWSGPLFSGDAWGHVAIVEAVNDNGTIDLSEYNWSPPHGYSYRRNVNPSSYGSHSYIY
ncbi:MAG TPA: CHAP domain-containing protein [bacterium]|jgi:surface antigen|nr:CHAP domain-containing protein [bacterium]